MSSSRSLVAASGCYTPWLEYALEQYLEIRKLIVCSRNGTEMVDILVGVPTTLYRVMKRKLLNVIPNFAAILDEDSKVHLSDIGCEEFDVLMEYVENGSTSIRPMQPGAIVDTVEQPSWNPIILFSFAEKLELVSLQNLIMDCTV